MFCVHKFLGLPIVALLALAGCRTNPACERQIGLMRSELIALEDKYYALEDKYHQAVGHGSNEFQSCDPSLPQSAPAPPKTNSMPPSRPSDSDIQIPIDPKDSSGAPLPTADPIAADFPASGAPSVVTFQTPRRFANQRPLQPPREAGHHQPESSAGFPGADNSSVPSDNRSDQTSLLFIDPAQLTGRDEDGAPGDDGLSLVVQIPRDQWSLDGVLTVSLLDPQEVGDRQRIGLWQISAQEIASATDPTAGGTSAVVPLDLDWNINAPGHSDLKLFVRWENPGANPLESSEAVAIVPDPSSSSVLPVVYSAEASVDPTAVPHAESDSEDDTSTPPPANHSWEPNR